jgi:hypothetical protein
MAPPLTAPPPTACHSLVSTPHSSGLSIRKDFGTRAWRFSLCERQTQESGRCRFISGSTIM